MPWRAGRGTPRHAAREISVRIGNGVLEVFWAIWRFVALGHHALDRRHDHVRLPPGLPPLVCEVSRSRHTRIGKVEALSARYAVRQLEVL
jgi:hypothetical protein